MKLLKMVFFFGFVTLAIFLVGCATVDDDMMNVSDSGFVVPMQDLEYDWGDINIKGGDVDHVFMFRNDGDEDLILKGAETSCMCTTATFVLPNGDTSPSFGMSGGRGWTYAVKPGEEFAVDVVFDPMAHGPNATGPIQRSVSLLTSSSGNGKIVEMKLAGNVLSEAAFERSSKKMSDVSSAFENISASELKTMLKNKDFFLLDVHIPEQEHIEGTDAFVPYNEISDNLEKLPSDKFAPIVVYCRSGSMSLIAADELVDLGYANVMNLNGGINAYMSLLEFENQ